jgi:hypothetical protein
MAAEFGLSKSERLYGVRCFDQKLTLANILMMSHIIRKRLHESNIEVSHTVDLLAAALSKGAVGLRGSITAYISAGQTILIHLELQ